MLDHSGSPFSQIQDQFFQLDDRIPASSFRSQEVRLGVVSAIPSHFHSVIPPLSEQLVGSLGILIELVHSIPSTLIFRNVTSRLTWGKRTLTIEVCRY